MADHILLENGDRLLTEDGLDVLITEAVAAAAAASADIIIVGGRNNIAKRIMDKYYIKL